MAVSFRALSPSLVAVLLFTISLAEAKEFLVGGKSIAWKIPSSQSETLNHWAEATRFNIGDSLVWKYDSKQDSVLQVDRRAYMNCNISSPIAEHNDGNTKVELTKSGPYYFISGAKGHCEKGQKLIVVVISHKHRALLAPAPSPMGFDGPAVAPTSGAHGLKSGLMVVVLGSLVGMVFT